jgi:hypothetical protein
MPLQLPKVILFFFEKEPHCFVLPVSSWLAVPLRLPGGRAPGGLFYGEGAVGDVAGFARGEGVDAAGV